MISFCEIAVTGDVSSTQVTCAVLPSGEASSGAVPCLAAGCSLWRCQLQQEIYFLRIQNGLLGFR